MKRSLIAMVAIWCTLMVACSRESKQERSVQTTTGNQSTTAPPSQEAAKRDKALVRVVDAMPGQPAVDAFSGDSRIFSHVTYKTVTPYAELPDDRQRLTLKPADQLQALAENSENFSGGKHYTLIAMPSSAKDAKPQLRVLADEGCAILLAGHAPPPI